MIRSVVKQTREVVGSVVRVLCKVGVWPVFELHTIVSRSVSPAGTAHFAVSLARILGPGAVLEEELRALGLASPLRKGAAAHTGLASLVCNTSARSCDPML